MVMPYQEGCDRRSSRSRSCTNLVTAILAVLLSLTVGIIVGTLFAGILFFALPALIVLGIVFALLLVLNLILAHCRRNDRCC